MISKKFLTLFRAGKLGPLILDDVLDANIVSWVVKFHKVYILTFLYAILQLYMLAFSLPTPHSPFFFFLFFLLLYFVNVLDLLKLYYKAKRCFCVGEFATFLRENLPSSATNASYWPVSTLHITLISHGSGLWGSFPCERDGSRRRSS